jgi:hypothetical protein
MKKLLVLVWVILVAITGILLAVFIHTELGIEHPSFFIFYGGAFMVVMQVIFIGITKHTRGGGWVMIEFMAGTIIGTLCGIIIMLV